MRRVRRQLPKVLIIDDQFGRCGLGSAFRKRVGEELFRAYQADRENLCRIYGISDGTGDSAPIGESSALVYGIFCPGQRWDTAKEAIENDLNLVHDTVRRGWPFKDGDRWALILLDLRFASGRINDFGDPEIGSVFGLDQILPMLRSKFGGDLPIVVLSSTPKEDGNAIVRSGGALDFIQRIRGAGATPEEGRAALEEAIFTHGLIPDATGRVAGISLASLKMLRQARRGARTARNILLLGETGTGKNLLAQYIHEMSPRSKGPYEVFQAAHRSAELQTDELFGHKKGAFTGAISDSHGIWERADGGTLFIDEVADIDLKVQQALMQPIEERIVRRVGSGSGDKPMSVDVLVILATNRDLRDAASSGQFKGDLLNRINAFVIDVPPLRSRREDIPALISILSKTIAPTWGGRVLPDAMRVLVERDWINGNIRELRNVLERAIANNPRQDIAAADIYDHDSEPRRNIKKMEQVEVEQSRPDLAHALLLNLRDIPLGEVENLKHSLSGALSGLVADVLVFALELTQVNGRLNPTAAVRFLVGQPELTTVQAKQFLKRALMLDTQSKSVCKKFGATGIADRHETLRRLVDDCLRPRRTSEDNTLNQSGPATSREDSQ